MLFAMTSMGGEPSPREQARRFIDDLARDHESIRSSFLESSYREAVAAARRESKFLVIFLHSKLHQDAGIFLRETMATADVQSSFSDCVCWAGSIEYPEPFLLTQALRVTAFPFVGMLLCTPREAHCVERLEGMAMLGNMVDMLMRARNKHQGRLVQLQQESLVRQESSQLRQEQDLEFERALEAVPQREADAQVWHVTRGRLSSLNTPCPSAE